MISIFKREVRSYFRTPLGYVIVAVAYFFSGYYFFTYNLYGNTTDLTKLFELLFPIVLFLVPVLTMRLMSEEKRSKTDQQLLTAPISRLGIIVGKYFSAVVVFLIAISGTLVDAIIASFYGKVDWPCVIGNFIGLCLLGLALIAICLFLSSIVEHNILWSWKRDKLFTELISTYCINIAFILPGKIKKSSKWHIRINS